MRKTTPILLLSIFLLGTPSLMSEEAGSEKFMSRYPVVLIDGWPIPTSHLEEEQYSSGNVILPGEVFAVEGLRSEGYSEGFVNTVQEFLSIPWADYLFESLSSILAIAIAIQTYRLRKEHREKLSKEEVLEAYLNAIHSIQGTPAERTVSKALRESSKDDKVLKEIEALSAQAKVKKNKG